MLSRRAVLAAALVAGGAAAAHTPYGQWVVYRQKHLLVGAHRGDPETYALAQRIVSALEIELPEARARVARGPRAERISRLLITGQLSLAVLDRGEAARMAAADPPFEGMGPAPLKPLAALSGAYVLYAHPDMDEEHVWLVTAALDHDGIGAAPAG
ncbi:MAG: hypothetical protein AAF913_03145, partial [Pseudomonadota bacterium]